MPDDLPSRVIADIAFIGRSGGQVKTLRGFKKSHHTLPDAVNAATSAFLGRICEAELAEESERLFQEVRAGFGYKRKDLTLTVSSPTAVLAAKDFTVEILYALEPEDTTRFAVTTTMRQLRDAAFARRDEMARIFAGGFSEISFGLRKSMRVEAMIDAIESLENERSLSVNYPSDCRECVIRVAEVDAEVRCSGAALEVIFPRAASPAELINAFAAVRDAFRICKPLSGLIG